MLSVDDICTVKSPCPALISIAVPISVLSAFLKGRKIRHLEWSPYQWGGYVHLDPGSPLEEFQDIESLIHESPMRFPLWFQISLIERATQRLSGMNVNKRLPLKRFTRVAQ